MVFGSGACRKGHSLRFMVQLPSWEWYYKAPSYRSPSFSPEYFRGDSDAAMQFIYPFPAVLELQQLNEREKRSSLAHSNRSNILHLVAEYVGETSNIHQMELSPNRVSMPLQ